MESVSFPSVSYKLQGTDVIVKMGHLEEKVSNSTKSHKTNKKFIMFFYLN
jgi:hypothetical protein